VKFNAITTTGELIVVGASGVLRRDYTLEVDHDFRYWLTGVTKLGYASTIFSAWTASTTAITSAPRSPTSSAASSGCAASSARLAELERPQCRLPVEPVLLTLRNAALKSFRFRGR